MEVLKTFQIRIIRLLLFPPPLVVNMLGPSLPWRVCSSCTCVFTVFTFALHRTHVVHVSDGLVCPRMQCITHIFEMMQLPVHFNVVNHTDYIASHRSHMFRLIHWIALRIIVSHMTHKCIDDARLCIGSHILMHLPLNIDTLRCAACISVYALHQISQHIALCIKDIDALYLCISIAISSSQSRASACTWPQMFSLGKN